MLPELMIAMSASASARIASATRLPRLVSDARRWSADGVERHAGRADDRVERRAQARLERRDHGRGSRLVGEGGGDRQQLEEPLDRAAGAPVDVDARDEFRVGAGLADERAVLGGGDRVVFVSADDQVDLRKPLDQRAIVGEGEVGDGDDDRARRPASAAAGTAPAAVERIEDARVLQLVAGDLLACSGRGR